MKKFVFCLLALIAPIIGQASHIVGGEFELIHISGSIYRLNLVLYFDLHNGNAGARDPSADVRIFRKSDNLVMQQINLPLVEETSVLYTAIECTIDELQTSKLLYSTLIELSPDEYNDLQGYYVAWERCCRNYGITNIFSEVTTFPDGTPNPDAKYAGQTFYLEFPAVVKDGEPFIDSTPKLFPPLSDYACVNKPYYVDFAGTDDDGDSLVYSLATPLNTITGSALPPGGLPRPRPYPDVSWQTGFSLNRVMKGSPDLAISTEGLLTVTPTLAGLFAFAVKCEEFRDGIKIGETRRDFQMLAVTCPSTGFPVITGTKPDNPNTVYKDVMNITFQSDAPDEERCVTVEVGDPDALNGDVNVSIRARGVKGSGGKVILPEIKTSTINSVNKKATFKICFDKCALALNVPYQVQIIASDDACAVPLQDTLKINVTIKSPANGKVEFSEPVPDVVTVLKQGDPKVAWPFKAVDPDGDSIIFSYLVNGFLLANAGMKLEYSQLQKGTVNGLLTWDPSCSFNFSSMQNFNVTLIANDKDLCDYNKADRASFNLTVIPPPKPDIALTQPGCTIATGTITVKAQNSNDTYSFNNGVSFQAANSKSGLAPGTYQIVTKNSSGCKSVATQAVINEQPETPNPQIDVIQPTCSLATGLIAVTVKASSDVYSFDGGVTFQVGNIKSGLIPGTYSVIVKNNAGCGSIPVGVTISNQPPKPTAPALTIAQTNTFPICTNTGTITVTVQKASDTYSFDNGATFQSGNTKSGLAAGMYKVVIKNSEGCKSVSTDANIALLPAPTVTIVQPTCTSTIGTITVSVQNVSDTYSFDNGTNFQASNIKSGLTSGTYQIVIKDVNGCKSAITSALVKPPALTPPNIVVTHPICTLATGTINVTVRDATDVYSFNNGLTFQANNAKSGLTSGTYMVVVKNSSGCASLAVPSIINPQPLTPAPPVVFSVTHPTCTIATGAITVTRQKDDDTYSFDNGVSFQIGNSKSGLPTGSYQVVIKNNEGCKSVSTKAIVNAQPDIPSTPMVNITQPPCKGTTGTLTVTVQRIGDTFSFDNGLNFQTSNMRSGLAAGAYSVVVKNSVGCTSITSVVVNPPPGAPPLAVISGSPIVCPNVKSVEYSASNEQYTYKWFITGGSLKTQNGNEIKVDWGTNTSNAWVKAIATDLNNCPVDTMRLQVKVQPTLKPSIPRGPDSICYNFRLGAPYQISATSGSVYTWFTDGGVVSEGQLTSAAKIDWADEGKYKVWVKERSGTCEGVSEPLNVTIFKDLAALNMNFASVDFEDKNKIRLQWDATLLKRISEEIVISRRVMDGNGSWEQIATLNKGVQAFSDQNVQPDQFAYDYRIEGFNKCDESLQTLTHNTIRLTGEKVEEDGQIELFWNAYNGWEVEQYEIWRKLDGAANYELLDVNDGSITNYAGKHGSDGFIHRLRVKAKKKDANIVSWSNEIDLTFDNPIEIPNVFTPTGDDEKNEYFTISRIHLYPDNELSIYNSWGKTVYESRNYKNNWRADGLANGVYYYSLYLKASNKMMKGWVQVVR